MCTCTRIPMYRETNIFGESLTIRCAFSTNIWFIGKCVNEALLLWLLPHTLRGISVFGVNNRII